MILTGGIFVIAEIVLNSLSKAIDSVYHYVIPTQFEQKISVGMRVEVEFGKGNSAKEGFVVGITDKSDFKELKPIKDIIDDTVYFDEKSVRLAEFMRHRYFCSYVQAIKTIIPVGINTKFLKLVFLDETDENIISECTKNSFVCEKIVSELKKCSPLTIEQLTSNIGRGNIANAIRNLTGNKIIHTELVRNSGIKDSVTSYASLSCDIEDAYEFCDKFAKKSPAQVRALELLCDYGEVMVSELMEMAGVSKQVIDALCQKGYVTVTKSVVRKDLFQNECVSECIKHTLNDEQSYVAECVSNSIKNGECVTYLLHGITGSGKTEVYLNLIQTTIDKGKKAILLVPEIALTPQMISRVVSRFPDRVAVIHSSLTIKPRYEQWKKIKDNEVDVVVGARSAVFAPFDNIGIIIVDEEHENTYKSECSPRYHAVEIARYRARQNNSVLLLASATPSVESYYKAQTGKYKLLEMNKRATDAALPQVEIVDMRKEIEMGNMSVFSNVLCDLIRENIQNNKQTILFLNRRGHSSSVSCRKCGYTVKCPRCNVSMTYHKYKNKMMCHYCDYMCDYPQTCPQCGSGYIKHFGTGTQKVAEEIEKLFPDATYLRMDADTTSNRTAHERILAEFVENNVNILIGTQMVTKGFDFENVTLVGVLAADMSLNQDDYRAAERTFNLVTQVCGRAGRGKYAGKAVIQTYSPDDDTIIFSSMHDYKSFYKNEIGFRQMMVYPPFCEFINFVFTDKNYNVAKTVCQSFYNDLKILTKPFNSLIEVYLPNEAPIKKINDKYRFRILAKGRYNKDLYDAIGNLYNKYLKSKNSVSIVVDVNPQNMY